MSKNLTVIFAKSPELGRTKTRIAQDTNEQFALDFTKACLRDLIQRVKGSRDYDLKFAVDSEEDRRKLRREFGLDGIVFQGPDSKSGKFNHIFGSMLNGMGYQNGILIPMDLAFLSRKDLNAAFSDLQNKDVVLGPETNGGVYLMGLRKPYTRNIFRGVRWSTQNSFEDLRRNCEGLSLLTLPQEYDLNTFQEVLSYRGEIAKNCPNLTKLLKVNGYYRPDAGRYVNFDRLDINIPVVCAIIERVTRRSREILLQTRYKPITDPKNTGKLEIPSGLMKKYEPAPVAAIREAREETGLVVEIIDSTVRKDKQGESHTISYAPFLCSQQIQGDRAYLALAFLCRPKTQVITPNLEETRDPHWVNVYSVKERLNEKPEDFFPPIRGVLREYINFLRL